MVMEHIRSLLNGGKKHRVRSGLLVIARIYFDCMIILTESVHDHKRHTMVCMKAVYHQVHHDEKYDNREYSISLVNPCTCSLSKYKYMIKRATFRCAEKARNAIVNLNQLFIEVSCPVHSVTVIIP